MTSLLLWRHAALTDKQTDRHKDWKSNEYLILVRSPRLLGRDIKQLCVYVMCKSVVIARRHGTVRAGATRRRWRLPAVGGLWTNYRHATTDGRRTNRSHLSARTETWRPRRTHCKVAVIIKTTQFSFWRTD